MFCLRKLSALIVLIVLFTKITYTHNPYNKAQEDVRVRDWSFGFFARTSANIHPHVGARGELFCYTSLLLLQKQILYKTFNVLLVFLCRTNTKQLHFSLSMSEF